MLVCKHCSTPNSLDSTFCKKCGTAVPADEKREATAQLDKLVAEGLAALNEGRTSEALAIADSAVASDPTHLGALHLKSAVHERRGELADALESAERIVELNPESELDRIKRNGLRSALLDATQPVAPDRRIAFMAAAAVAVLILSGGLLYARSLSNKSTQVAMNDTPKVIVEQPPVNNQSTQVAPQTQQAPTVQVPVQQPVQNPVLPPTQQNLEPIRVDPRGDIGQLPTTGPNIDLGSPEGQSSQKPNPTPTPKPPTQTSRTGEPTALPANDEEDKDAGVYDIKVTSGTTRVGGGSPIRESATNGAAAYARVGEERFGLGDFAGAAINLERAVSSGGDPVQLNLRLGQAYSNLGRNSDAATAFERSRSAADSALASGRGNRERLQAARDAAEAGLRAARGN